MGLRLKNAVSNNYQDSSLSDGDLNQGSTNQKLIGPESDQDRENLRNPVPTRSKKWNLRLDQNLQIFENLGPIRANRSAVTWPEGLWIPDLNVATFELTIMLKSAL